MLSKSELEVRLNRHPVFISLVCQKMISVMHDLLSLEGQNYMVFCAKIDKNTVAIGIVKNIGELKQRYDKHIQSTGDREMILLNNEDALGTISLRKFTDGFQLAETENLVSEAAIDLINNAKKRFLDGNTAICMHCDNWGISIPEISIRNATFNFN